jgi:hypothetical protein
LTEKSLLFVESPLQLLNAYEAINKFNLINYKIVIRLSSEELNDKQMKNIVNYLKIDNISYILIKTKNRTIFDYAKLIFNRIQYLFTKVDKVFIGNYHSGFLNLIMKQFNKKKIILLDDGSKTIAIQNDFTENNFYNIFSMYDIKAILNQKIYKNEYSCITKICKNKETRNQDILFLGMKLSEYGIISEEYYMELITKISNYYNDKNIIYIPHRGESQKKLSLIEEYKNISIKYLEYPVELYGLYEDTIPYKVASFYSTALLTMKNIYKMEAESFIFDYTESEYQNAIDLVYEYNSKYFQATKLND